LGPRFEDQWRARFEEFADLSDDDAGIAGWTATGLEARVRRFLGLWHPEEPGRRWLDAGCGAGTYIRILLRHGHQVVGVDYSLPTLRKAVARGLNGAAFAVADVRRLPFGQEQFDGVLCFGVTQALDKSEPAVSELARLLKPGGHLWIDGLNGWCVIHALGGLRRRALGGARHLRYESPRRVKRLCRQCGFTDVRLHWMPIMPRHSHLLQRAIEARPLARVLACVPLLGALISHAFIIQATKGDRATDPGASRPAA
jgi:SAM-dependent methyltransferase